MSKKIIIDKADNIAVYLEESDNIPKGHKEALRDIKKGEYIIKYGEVIGRATEDIKKGDWVHSHNLRSQLDEAASYTYNYKAYAPEEKKATFKGYRRDGRRAGIRNEILIVPSVGCVNGVCKALEKAAQEFITGSIDGVYALTHQFGCSQLGDDNENIKNLLASIALNPNATYVLFVGLGCENNGLDGIKEVLKDSPNSHIYYINAQDEVDEVETGTRLLKELCEKASKLEREDIDISELTLGVKCGGSDGFSGLTANPLVGKISDRIVSYGGSVVLTEVPEMFGAEQQLMNKCESEAVFESLKALVERYKNFYEKNGFPVYENPSPGNKKGGITTLEEKSLGCVKKAGSTTVVDVIDYGERVKKTGVTVLDAPGNDLIAATALGAAGCQIVLFTTGRGTPFSTFVPTLKVSTNTALATKKGHWIDFDAEPMDEDAFWNKIFSTVEGAPVNEEHNREIAFYKTGVTL